MDITHSVDSLRLYIKFVYHQSLIYKNFEYMLELKEKRVNVFCEP